jgi:gliding motility-associated-like protein
MQPQSAIVNPTPVSGSIEINRNPTYVSYTPKDLVEKIFIGSGSCSLVENITYSGAGWNGVAWNKPSADRTLGYFHKGTSGFPLEEGLIMTTGKIGYMEGSNDNTGGDPTNSLGAPIGDADLQSLVPMSPLNNVVVLEFDFTPVGNILEFKYIFASKEYPMYVHSQFNDVFGFFINEVTTPGIKDNIALLPTSETSTRVVSINNVNNGQKNDNSSPFPGTNPVNSIYFVTNIDGSPTTEFNGYTVTLTATANVDPCKKYHLKLAVGNISDAQYNSGVFLEARSFNLGASLVNFTGSIEGKNEIFEGCSNTLSVRRAGDLSGTQVTNLSYSGTAVNGVDFNLPTSVTFAPGQDEINLPYTVIDDMIPNNGRYFDITVNCPCSIAGTFTHRINVYEPAALNTPIATCNSIKAGMIGGFGIYEYSIDGGTTWQTSDLFTGLTSGTYTLLGRDIGSCYSSSQSVTLVSPIAISTATSMLCGAPNSGSIAVTASGGANPYKYSINNGTTWQASPNFTGLTAGTYTVLVEDNNGCRSSLAVNLSHPPIPSAPTITQTNALCYGSSDGSLVVSMLGGNPPFQYSIDNGTTFSANASFTGLAAGTYTVIVKDNFSCQSTPLPVQITQPAELTPALSIIDNTCKASIDLSGTTGGTGSQKYSIDNGTTWQTSPMFSNLSGDSYTVMAEDQNGCRVSKSVTLNTDYKNILPNELPVYKTRVPYSLQLQAFALSPYTFVADSGFPLWLNIQPGGELNGIPTNVANITYTLTVKLIDANGCEVFKTYTLNGTLFVPDIFTPNGDGVNDHFMKGFKVTIFDRLGTKIFEGEDGWDGTRKGKIVADDTYFYVLIDGDKKETGSVTVITK